MTIRELIVSLGIKVDEKGLKAFEQAIGGLKQSVGELIGFVAKLGAAYVGAAGFLGALSAQSADFAEEVLRSADAFGITVEKYQELRFAFQALGASTDDLADAMGTLTDRAVDAMEGGKTYRKEFERIGIAVDDLKGKDPAQLLMMWTEAASNATDETQAITSAVRLLGDDLGRRIARGLRTSGSNFIDYIRIINEVGGVFDRELLEKGKDAQIQFRMLGGVFQMLKRRIGLELAPIFGELAQKITDTFLDNQDALEDFIRRLKEGVQREMERVLYWADRVDAVVQRQWGSWGALFADIATAIGVAIATMFGAKVLAVIASLATVIGALSLPLIIVAAKVAAVAAVIGALVLIFEDLWFYVNGGNSLIGKMIDKYKDAGGVLGFFATLLELTGKNFALLIEEAKVFWQENGPAIITIGKFIARVLGGLLVGALLATVNILILVARATLGLIAVFQSFADETVKAFDVITDVMAGQVARELALLKNLFKFFTEDVVDFFSVNFIDPFLRQIDMALQVLKGGAQAVRAVFEGDFSGALTASEDTMALGADFALSQVGLASPSRMSEVSSRIDQRAQKQENNVTVNVNAPNGGVEESTVDGIIRGTGDALNGLFDVFTGGEI